MVMEKVEEGHSWIPERKEGEVVGLAGFTQMDPAPGCPFP